MAERGEAPMVKLICGMLSARAAVLDAAAEEMAKTFGPVDIISPAMDFDFTHYYDAQMGSPLQRRFVGFARPVRAHALVYAKQRTNEIEADFARRFAAELCIRRPANLDVGYLEPSKLVLASMKNFSHRIYLDEGVYAEVTLLHSGGKWQSLPWTFPDFRSGRYDEFLSAARRLLVGGRPAAEGTT